MFGLVLVHAGYRLAGVIRVSFCLGWLQVKWGLEDDTAPNLPTVGFFPFCPLEVAFGAHHLTKPFRFYFGVCDPFVGRHLGEFNAFGRVNKLTLPKCETTNALAESATVVHHKKALHGVL